MAQNTLAEATKGKFLFGVAVNMQQVNGVNPKESELIAKEFNNNCCRKLYEAPTYPSGRKQIRMD